MAVLMSKILYKCRINAQENELLSHRVCALILIVIFKLPCTGVIKMYNPTNSVYFSGPCIFFFLTAHCPLFLLVVFFFVLLIYQNTYILRNFFLLSGMLLENIFPN